MLPHQKPPTLAYNKPVRTSVATVSTRCSTRGQPTPSVSSNNDTANVTQSSYCPVTLLNAKSRLATLPAAPLIPSLRQLKSHSCLLQLAPIAHSCLHHHPSHLLQPKANQTRALHLALSVAQTPTPTLTPINLRIQLALPVSPSICPKTPELRY